MEIPAAAMRAYALNTPSIGTTPSMPAGTPASNPAGGFGQAFLARKKILAGGAAAGSGRIVGGPKCRAGGLSALTCGRSVAASAPCRIS